MKHAFLAVLLPVCVPLCLGGCHSSNKQPDAQPQPRIEDSSAKAPSAEKPAAAQREEPIAINIKKGEKRGPEASFSGTPPPGQVCFDFKDLDLETGALPLFSDQAGVKVEYHSKNPRRVTLRLSQPVPWREALGLICQWTQTHVIQSSISGRLELKDGFADPGPFLAKWDPKSPGTAETTTTTNNGTVGGGDNPQPASGGTGGQAFDASDYQQPKQPGADRIDELRRGVTTTNSGAK